MSPKLVAVIKREYLQQIRTKAFWISTFLIPTPETLRHVRKKLNGDVQHERIKAYIVLDQKTLETGVAEWRAPSVKADIVTRESIASLLSRAATKVRLRDRGVDPALYDAARLSIDLD